MDETQENRKIKALISVSHDESRRKRKLAPTAYAITVTEGDAERTCWGFGLAKSSDTMFLFGIERLSRDFGPIDTEDELDLVAAKIGFATRLDEPNGWDLKQASGIVVSGKDAEELKREVRAIFNLPHSRLRESKSNEKSKLKGLADLARKHATSHNIANIPEPSQRIICEGLD